MKNILNNTSKKLSTMLIAGAMAFTAMASSHREAPMISGDPLADNTDLYAFRSPDDPNTITILGIRFTFNCRLGDQTMEA
ncbi:MAG: DUF4331 family protein, partial [Chitinophagales bacterium]|nr:DUF4331 family protein [Chitinophagales bacterium]